MDRGAWRAIVHGIAKSQTQLSNWWILDYMEMISWDPSPSNLHLPDPFFLTGLSITWTWPPVNNLGGNHLGGSPVFSSTLLLWAVLLQWKQGCHLLSALDSKSASIYEIKFTTIVQFKKYPATGKIFKTAKLIILLSLTGWVLTKCLLWAAVCCVRSWVFMKFVIPAGANLLRLNK